MAAAQQVQMPTGTLQAGEARILRVRGLSGGEALVFLGDGDTVRRVHRAGRDMFVVPWDVEQALHYLLDPHAVEAE